jgi:hypothetical protein
MTEFALTIPLFTLLVFVTIELGFLFVWYYSEVVLTQQSARWLAIHTASTDDSAFAAHLQATLLPGMIGGTPTVSQTGTSALPAIWTIGNLTAEFTPCVISGTQCTHANRQPKTSLYVQLTYDANAILFLPSTYHVGTLTVSLPTALPSYRVYATSE